ncbi:hypothetical protein [Streptomyces odontomachi]|uniref:hypothetical protein n=1 Tax=Streptomyces odontomachi TaxID=2944940 RepID=UPI00210C9C09|nr:hypothetical protein [Streptomyces sp. ODS25]
MAELIDPTVRLRASFLAAVSEFHEDRDCATPWFVRDIEPPALTDAAAFAASLAKPACPVRRTLGASGPAVPLPLEPAATCDPGAPE